MSVNEYEPACGCPNLAHCVASGDYINTGSNLFRTAILTNSP